MIKAVFDNTYAQGDLDFDAGLVDDETFETAIMISLFTNRLVDTEDDPPAQDYLEGFWGDTHPDIEGDLIGSKLWLLNNKTIQNTLELAKQYAEEALEWMIDDGIADSVEVEVQRGEQDQLLFGVWIQKPEEPAPQWAGRWAMQLEAR